MSEKNKFVSQFGTLSRYGELRKISLIYGSENILIWHLFAEEKEIDFLRLSCDVLGNIESVDLSGGPMIGIGDNFFGFGRVKKISVLSIGKESCLPSSGVHVILSCATSKIAKGHCPIKGKKKANKGARKASTGE